MPIRLFFLIALTLLIVLQLASIGLGSSYIALPNVYAALAQAPWHTPTDAQSQIHHFIIWHIRLPRVLAAALVGAALALAGAQMQGLLHNPLAAPGIIGVSSGAALGAVLLIASGWAAYSVWMLPVGSFIGAFLALLSVLLLARGDEHALHHSPMLTLLLTGIALNALFSALTSLLISLSWAEHEVTREMVFWLMGGLDNRTWTHVALLLPGVCFGFGLAFYDRRELDLLLSGEENAAALGVAVPLVRYRLLSGIALLTASAVAVAGVVGFVGLIVPHLARLLIGPQHRYLLPASALLGALLLVAVDLLARQISPDGSLRLGILTALLGAPFFLYLLLRKERQTGSS